MRLFTGFLRPTLPITGTDFAGEIEAVGSAVTHFKIGDAVWGFHDEGLGSHAEYLALKDNSPVAALPKNVSFAQAVAGLEAAHYAYNFIKGLSLTPASKVLVNGASGGIGSALLQFLKAKPVFVTAVCSSHTVDLMRSLGADKVIDYQQTDFTTDDDHYDLILDAVGKSTFDACRHLLRPKGIYISSELGPWLQNPLLAIITPFMGGKRVRFPLPTNIPESMRFIQRNLEAGTFSPVIDREYPLEQISDAFQYVASGAKTGNVIINYGATVG